MRTYVTTFGRTTRHALAATALLFVGSAHAVITLNLVGTQLTVNSDGADFISFAVTDASSPFNVSGQVTSINAGQVTQLIVNGSGSSQQIDLTSVSQAAFMQLTGVTINGGGGNDQIFGSQLADTITDPDGGDDLTGATGLDTFIITMAGAGGNVSITDTGGNLQITGTTGADEFTLTSASVALAAQTISFSANTMTAISVDGSTGNDTFNTVALNSTTLTFAGGDGSDTLFVNAELTAATSDATTVTVPGKQTINHSGIETVTVFNTASNPGGGPNANSNSGSNSNTNSGASNTNSGGTDNTNSGGTDNANTNSGGTTNNNGSGGGGGNTNSGGGGGNSNGSGGDPNSDPNDAPINNRNACGLMCGNGMLPMLPLMLAGLALMKLRRGRSA